MNEENAIPTAPINPAAAAAPGVVNPPMTASEMFQPEPTGAAPEVQLGVSAMPGAQPGANVAPSAQPGLSATVGGTAPVAASAPGMLGAMDPLTMPEKPAEPDPVEEELKAPFKAAAPVPGSIGSAVSMPSTAGAPNAQPGQPAASGTTPQSVAFNDPASENLMAEAAKAQAKSAAGKPKMSKQTLILLCVVAGLLILALTIVLVMMLAK